MLNLGRKSVCTHWALIPLCCFLSIWDIVELRLVKVLWYTTVQTTIQDCEVRVRRLGSLVLTPYKCYCFSHGSGCRESSRIQVDRESGQGCHEANRENFDRNWGQPRQASSKQNLQSSKPKFKETRFLERQTNTRRYC